MANIVILVGNVGKDPEVKHFNNSVRATFKLATSTWIKNSSTNKYESEVSWHSIVAWAGTAELIQNFVKKGMKVMVRGQIKYSNFQKGDQKIFSTSIICQEIEFLNRVKQEVTNETAYSSIEKEIFEEDDDLAF